jgi:CRP/FNR family transcriptional regulator, cyclic AMP receptor protein
LPLNPPEAWKSSPCLAGLSPDELEKFAACGTYRSVEPGEILIQPDQPQSNLYIIEEGLFSVERVKDGVISMVAELGPGEVLGEIAILQPPHASARVTATKKGRLWAISRAAFLAFLSAHPEPGKKFMVGLTRIFGQRFLSRP